MTERERQVMKKLKEVVDKQRDEIRAKDRELTLKNEDVEAVRSYVFPGQRPLISRKQDTKMSVFLLEKSSKSHPM